MILTSLSLHIELLHDPSLPGCFPLLAYRTSLNHCKPIHIYQLMHSLFMLLHDSDELFVWPDILIPEFSIFQSCMHSLDWLRLLLECVSKFLCKVLILHLSLSVKQPMILLQISVRLFEISHDFEILAPLLFLHLLNVIILQLLHLPFICLLLNLFPFPLVFEYLKHPLIFTPVFLLEGLFCDHSLLLQLDLGQFWNWNHSARWGLNIAGASVSWKEGRIIFCFLFVSKYKKGSILSHSR